MSSASATTRSDDRSGDRPGFGVYVHIPFCLKKCDYCAFATWTDREHLVGRYLDALIAQLRRAKQVGELPSADTVFFGGGTPSLIDPADIARVLACISLRPGAEVSIECNPDTVDEPRFSGYRAAGVNRVSIGVQSMMPHVLASLGRTHVPENVERAVGAAKAAGFGEINLDLIYGATGESVDDWQVTLDRAIALEPTHVSAYGLTVEAGTPLAEDPARHPDDDTQAEMYLVADASLEAAGLSNYEISNWARPSSECRHNRLYWAGGNYLGVGCAAHSHLDGRRFWNVRTPDRYVAAIETGGSPVAADETLDPATRRVERLQLQVRTREGVDAAAFGPSGVPVDIAHLVVNDGSRVRLTREGRLLANEVAIRLE